MCSKVNRQLTFHGKTKEDRGHYASRQKANIQMLICRFKVVIQRKCEKNRGLKEASFR